MWGCNYKISWQMRFPHGTVFRLYYIASFNTKNINMKQLTTRNGFRFFLTLLALSFIQLITFAQDSTSTSSSSTKTTTTTTTTWYTQPWIWIVGGVLLLIVIIALMRGNSSTTTERTTVIRDSTTDREV
jgi:H+/gluconate symporter-like permease